MSTNEIRRFREPSRRAQNDYCGRDFLRRGREQVESRSARYARTAKTVPAARSERHFLRSSVLLLFLILLPTAAVCWDQIPRLTEKAEKFWTTFRATESVEIEHRTAVAGPDGGSNAAVVPTTQDGQKSEQLSDSSETPFEWRAETGQTEPLDVSGFSEPISEEMERRLERLGVETGQLQKWGKGGRCWRYACRVRADADAAVTHEFEAIGVTADEALNAAVEKIARWRQTRLAAIREVFERPY